MKNNKGITLIALVITVILMLILVGVVVTGTRDGKIFDYAGKAISQTELSSIIEELKTKGLLKGKENLNGTLSTVLGSNYSKYDSTFKVVNGELIYTGDDENIIQTLLGIGQGEGTIQNASAICAVKGHNFKPANYLNPKMCTRCGQTEGTKLAATEPHPDQENSNDIGIGTDGELVNLDNWSYQLVSRTWKLTGYKGAYSEQGEIEGKVPQVINDINVTSMAATFNGNTNLKIAPEIPTTVQSMDSTFKGCTALTKAPLIPYGVINVSYTFQNCTSLTTLPEEFSLPDTVSGRIIGLFSGCSSLKELPNTFRVPAQVNSMFSWFNGCINLEKLPEGFTISDNVSELLRTFYNCQKLTELPDSFRLPSKANSLGYMFYGSGITKLPEGFTIPEGCTDMGNMFDSCISLQSLPNSFRIPSTMKNMSMAFERCSTLSQLPDGFALPEGLTNMNSAFYRCSNLKNIPENFMIPESATNFGRAFWSCPTLEGTIIIKGNPSTYDFCFSSVATSGDGLTVKYTEKCTNIDAIMATVSPGANITFEQITLESSAKKR